MSVEAIPTVTVEDDAAQQNELFDGQLQPTEDATELQERMSVAAECLRHENVFVHRQAIGQVQFIVLVLVAVGQSEKGHFVHAQLQKMRAFLDGQLAVAGHLHTELDTLHNTFLTEFVGLLPAKIGLLLET